MSSGNFIFEVQIGGEHSMLEAFLLKEVDAEVAFGKAAYRWHDQRGKAGLPPAPITYVNVKKLPGKVVE